MKKRIWKSVVSLALALSLTLGYSVAVVLAGDETTARTSKELAGGLVQGDIRMDNMSATATTTYGRGGGYIYATATVYYWWGDWTFKTTAGPVSNSMGGVSVTATKRAGGADVLGALGHHEAKWQGIPCVLDDTKVGIALTDPDRAEDAIEFTD